MHEEFHVDKDMFEDSENAKFFDKMNKKVMNDDNKVFQLLSSLD